MSEIYDKLSKERKKLQKAGEIPHWYTTAAYQMFKEKYQHEGATVKQTFRRIADTAASHLEKHNQNVQEWSDKFFTLLWNGWLSPSTPVLSNMGTNKGMAVSCSGGYIGDSLDDFYKSYHEVAMLTKFGFGTSAYLGDIRPRGSKISRGGKASGTKPVFEHFIHDMRVVTQGCYIEGTEVLTDKGFVDFRDITTDTNIAQLDEKRNVTFTKGEPTVRDWKGQMYRFKSTTGMNLEVTPNHRMMISRLRKSGWSDLIEVLAEDVKYHRDVQHHVAGNSICEDKLTPKEKFLIAYQADGKKSGVRFNNETFSLYFRFKKERKVNRLKAILEECGLNYSITKYKDESYNFSIKVDKSYYHPDFSWVNVADFTGNRGIEFLREVAEWDSHKTTEDRITYTSTDKSCVKTIQAIASINNIRTYLRIIPENGNRKEKYSLYFTFEYKPVQGESIESEIFDYEGKVYCCIVPNGRIIVRDKNNFVSVCGNTSRRGAFAAYVDIEHGDFDELADLVLHEPDDANIGWNITDEFIKKLNEGDEEADRRYKKAMKLKMVTGKGYFFFVDKVNRKRPQWYKDHNLTVKASNLCLRGNTTITIKNNGVEEIIRLDDFVEKYSLGMFVTPTVKTYKDGEVVFSEVTNAAITGTAKELIRIETESGKVIECTENHLIFTSNRGWVAAGELLETDTLVEG